jgi:hypothetical protein
MPIEPLQDVVDCFSFEGLDGMFIVRGHEHDRRHVAFPPLQAINKLKPGQLRHVDVEQQYVVRAALKLAESLNSIFSRVGYLNIVSLRQNVEQRSSS